MVILCEKARLYGDLYARPELHLVSYGKSCCMGLCGALVLRRPVVLSCASEIGSQPCTHSGTVEAHHLSNSDLSSGKIFIEVVLAKTRSNWKKGDDDT